MTVVDRDQRDLLRPYLPRPAIQWLAEAPQERVREVDGSVVFVDISGFTKMSERLARRGKVGAEEVTDNLGAIFARMLSVAYGEDGSLLKFGGDALLILFEGRDHAERAVRSAHGMRALLREAGRLQTSAGHVTLRMSVGVHAGRFHFFLVGESHHEFMVCGPAASRVVDMEGTATAGEILLSPEIAAMMPASVLGKPKGPGMLLRSSPGGLSVPAEPRQDGFERADLASAIPVAVREHVLQGAVDPEHRTVTVAFIHYDGIDRMVAEEGAAAVGEGLHELVSDVQRAVDQHGVTFLGTDVDHDGGKIILIAGAPRATGDDEERMLLAARQVIAVKRRIPVRIGVNRGPVFVGEVGPAYRRTYTVMGDAVNLAARVMAKAVPGQLLSTASVLERSRTSFSAEPLEPFMVKGKAKPVQAWDVGEVASRELPVESQVLPFSGRDAELAVLRTRADDAREHRGGLVEILGEIGIGKSRLFEQWRAELDDFRVLEGRAELYEENTPYFPWRRILRQAIGLDDDAPVDVAAKVLRASVQRAAPDLVPWTPLLAEPLGIKVPETTETSVLDQRFRRAKVVDVVSSFLGAILDGPTILRLEDAEWLDEPSCELLGGIAGAAATRPWIVVALARGATGIDVSERTTVELGALDLDACVAMIEAEADAAGLLPPAQLALAERSAGNPLFLRELVRIASSAGAADELPDSVETLVAAKIDRLDVPQRGVLRLVSVLGNRFEPDLARSVIAAELPGISGDPLQDVAAFLVESGDGTMRFASALVRDVAYEGLPFKRRRALHARIGEQIEREVADPQASAELLSYHFFHSDHPEKAWEFSFVAGERAFGMFAHVEAAEFYRRALTAAKQLSLPGTEIALVGEHLGVTLERAGRYREAIAAVRAVRKQVAGDAVRTAKLMFREADIAERLGNYRLGKWWCRRGLSTLEGVEGTDADAVRAELKANYAGLLQGDPKHYREAIRFAEEAMELAVRVGDPVRGVMAHCAHCLDWVYFAMGKPDEAPYPGLALQIYQEIEAWGGVQNEYVIIGLYAYLQGRWDEAIEMNDKAFEIGLRRGDVVNAHYATNNTGEIYSDQGRLDEAERSFTETLKVARTAGRRELQAHATGNLGRVASKRGRHDEAVRLLEEAKVLFHEVGEERPIYEMDARLAENQLYQGRGAEAIEIADKVLAQIQQTGGLQLVLAWLHRIRGSAFIVLDDPFAARAALTEALESGRQGEATYEVGLTLDALATLDRLEGDETAAEGRAAESRTILEGLGVVHVPAIPPPARADLPSTSP